MLCSVNESGLSSLNLDFLIVFDMCQYAIVTHVTIKKIDFTVENKYHSRQKLHQLFQILLVWAKDFSL